MGHPAKMRKYSWVIFFALIATSGCRGPSTDWNGTWKVDPSKGNFHGPVFSISISADGQYLFHYNGRPDITFRCDGKDQPAGEKRTRACVKSSPTVLDLIVKENGVKAVVTHWELSTYGKTLMWTTTTFRPSGPVITDEFVASRISGSNDFAGEWRNMNYLQQHADLTLRLDNQTLHMAYPSAGVYVDASFNGADAPVRGPRASGLATYSVRLAGRRKIITLAKLNGKAMTQGILELSRDGRMITVSWWNPSRPNDKGTLVYEKK